MVAEWWMMSPKRKLKLSLVCFQVPAKSFIDKNSLMRCF